MISLCPRISQLCHCPTCFRWEEEAASSASAGGSVQPLRSHCNGTTGNTLSSWPGEEGGSLGSSDRHRDMARSWGQSGDVAQASQHFKSI